MKVLGIFKDPRHEQYVCVTDQWKQPGVVAKCFYIVYDKKNDNYAISWTVCNVVQLSKAQPQNVQFDLKQMPPQAKKLLTIEAKKLGIKLC